MRNKRAWPYLVLGVFVALSVFFGVAPHLLWSPWQVYDVTLHSAVEAMGALAAIVMAAFLLQRDEDGVNYLMLSLGFIGMGTLDLFHAISPPGPGFVFLHSVAGLCGGFFFSLTWLPLAGVKAPLRKWFPWAVAVGSVMFGAWALGRQDNLPAMVVNGEFTLLAKGINASAGILLVAAAARQLTDFQRRGDFEPYIFSCLLLMFGLAALTFSYSALWDDIWWLWHLERLLAYVLVLWWIIKKHQGLVRELRGVISERKRSEEERSSLYHMLAHDLRGPLTLVYGYTEILEKQVDAPSADMVKEIKKAAGRISALIDDMLALCKAESCAEGLNREPVRLAEVLGQAVLDSEMAASEIDVTIDLKLEDIPAVVIGDRVQLMRAFGNLVANAVKYNRQGGKVGVRAWADEGAPGTVMVEVSDTGAGISEEDIPHVFEKFYRGGRTGGMGGTGLGLAVVKAVVLSHGGKVSVTSRVREGSKFTVALPVSSTSPP